MVPKIMTAAVVGLDASLIEVEADISNGLPNTIIVGLPGLAVQESRERIKSALKNTGFVYPYTRVSVNLAPADVPKAGTHYDLPIALAILLASGQADFVSEDKLFLGELSLDGRLRTSFGVLPIALQARQAGFKEIYVPEANAAEAALVEGIKVFGIRSLPQLIRHLLGLELIISWPTTLAFNPQCQDNPIIDLADIAGQELAKRAVEVASSGLHNICLHGPPGSGKTMLARAMAGILPGLSFDEGMELAKIYSIAGKLNDKMITTRPVRTPHHTSSQIALVGGGAVPRPGEITLAHRGILFLDEFPEFHRGVLEALRQPLEDGVVTISRAKSTLTFPARFVLVAAMNPCPCGYYGDPEQACSCKLGQVLNYQKRLSGPLLDRIDLHIEVPRLPYEKLAVIGSEESSADVRARVEQAREIQYNRFGKTQTNSEMSVAEIKTHCRLDEASHVLLRSAAKKYLLSGRSVHRVLKVARTIADLVSSSDIAPTHLAEALQYRIRQG